jgi:hypothetical protein
MGARGSASGGLTIMISKTRIVGAMALLLLTGCATMPTGPSVMVLPGQGISFEQFRTDDYACRQFAFAQVGGANANAAPNNSAVTTAAAATAIGTAAGAAIGGSKEGAEVGAGTGLLVGSAMGANVSQQSTDALQHSYDVSYIQCMYAKGNQVPIYGNQIAQQSGTRYYGTPPPPAAGTPPPPPPATAH